MPKRLFTKQKVYIQFCDFALKKLSKQTLYTLYMNYAKKYTKIIKVTTKKKYTRKEYSFLYKTKKIN